jgi:uncharacterized protein
VSQIVIGKAGTRNVTIDLDVLLRTRLLVQANSGGGKSWLLRRIAEQLFGKIPVIIIDPEGEFATLREKYGYVLAGKGGETPADPRSASLLAHRLLETRASCVCDLYEMKPSERHHWVRLFLEALIDAPKKLWRPTIVIVDEAHTFCPEKGAGESEASDAMTALPTRGRKRRFCAIWATQRLGKLRKDASAELLNRLIGPTFEDVDLKRAAELLSIRSEDRRAFDAQMRVLEPGNFFALGRAITKERLLVRVGNVRTSHEIEDAKYGSEPPPTPDKIKALLPKLADLPKQAEEQAKTVAQFQSEIRSLKAQLRIRPSVAQEVKVTDQKTTQKLHELELMVRELNKYASKCENFIATQASAMGNAIGVLEKMCKIQPPAPELRKVAKLIPKYIPLGSSFVNAKPATRENLAPYTRPASPVVAQNDGNVKLRDGAERMLAAVAQWSPEGMTVGQMRAHAGLKKSGTFSAYMSDLRKHGLIEERNGLVFSTQGGLDYCKHIPAAPQTTEEVLSIWEPKLRDGARRMLRVLVEGRGEAMSKEELGERANLQKSGTFSAYLSDLKTARLAIVHRDGVAANRETLFL